MSAFTPAGSGGKSVQVEIEGSTNPIVSNVPLTVASTEVDILLPNDCKKFFIRLRDSKAYLQLAYISGESGIEYLTINPGCFFSDSQLSVSGLHIYLQSPSASQIVELVTWT